MCRYGAMTREFRRAAELLPGSGFGCDGGTVRPASEADEEVTGPAQHGVPAVGRRVLQ